MKIIDFFYIIISTTLLVVNQIALKVWLTKSNIIVWPLNLIFFRNLFSLEILISIASIGISGLIWLTLLKRIEFSILYPMISFSYIIGLLAAIFVFKESVPLIRWVGVSFIMIGIFFISRS